MHPSSSLHKRTLAHNDRSNSTWLESVTSLVDYLAWKQFQFANSTVCFSLRGKTNSCYFSCSRSLLTSCSIWRAVVVLGRPKSGFSIACKYVNSTQIKQKLAFQSRIDTDPACMLQAIAKFCFLGVFVKSGLLSFRPTFALLGVGVTLGSFDRETLRLDMSVASRWNLFYPGELFFCCFFSASM